MQHKRYEYKFDSDTLTFKKTELGFLQRTFDVKEKDKPDTEDLQEFYKNVDGLPLAEKIKLKKQAMTNLWN